MHIFYCLVQLGSARGSFTPVTRQLARTHLSFGGLILLTAFLVTGKRGIPLAQARTPRAGALPSWHAPAAIARTRQAPGCSSQTQSQARSPAQAAGGPSPPRYSPGRCELVSSMCMGRRPAAHIVLVCTPSGPQHIAASSPPLHAGTLDIAPPSRARTRRTAAAEHAGHHDAWLPFLQRHTDLFDSESSPRAAERPCPCCVHADTVKC